MESDDEDLKRAIALSLGDEGGPQDRSVNAPAHRAVIDLLSEDESSADDMGAPTSSKNHADDDSPRKAHVTHVSMKHSIAKVDLMTNPPTSSQPSSTTNSLGIAGLDRKQMEEARLARLSQKRKREGHVAETDGQDAGPRKIPKPNESIATTNPRVISNNFTLHDSLQFPDGVVKRTWAFGYPRKADDIKIEEVIHKPNLELAILSAFQIDVEWITSKLNPDTRVIWVLQAKTEAEKANWRSSAPPQYRFCFPSMAGNINCMHSKLQLLAYSSHLRIVVPSANLTPYDWGETGVMENTCFIIDLPRLAEEQATNELTDFGKDLMYFMTAMGLDKPIVDSIKRFDFTRTKKYAFIHSSGGNHSGEDMHRTGFCGLAKRVQDLGLQNNESIQVDFVASSIGSLKEDFIESIYQSAQGILWDETEPQTRKSAQQKATKQTPAAMSDLSTRFRVYFPTRKTVRGSKGGYPAGGTICISPSYYDAPGFPRAIMRDCKSQRTGLLMHNKIMFVSGPSSSWAYVGSANLSESAWGRVVKDRSTKQWRLNLRNWECGVLVTSHKVDSHEDVKHTVPDQDKWKVFEHVLPVPIMTEKDVNASALLYGDERPWFFMGGA